MDAETRPDNMTLTEIVEALKVNRNVYRERIAALTARIAKRRMEECEYGTKYCHWRDVVVPDLTTRLREAERAQGIDTYKVALASAGNEIKRLRDRAEQAEQRLGVTEQRYVEQGRKLAQAEQRMAAERHQALEDALEWVGEHGVPITSYDVKKFYAALSPVPTLTPPRP